MLGMYAAAGGFAYADLAAVALLVGSAGLLLAKSREQVQAAPRSDERKRADRDCGIVNAVTWIVVFLVFSLFSRFHLDQWIFPALAFLVGIHFFFLPKLYLHRANLAAGSAITL